MLAQLPDHSRCNFTNFMFAILSRTMYLCMDFSGDVGSSEDSKAHNGCAYSFTSALRYLPIVPFPSRGHDDDNFTSDQSPTLERIFTM